MSAWRSGAENQPAWLQSTSTRVRGMFLRLHHEIGRMRISMENGFGKSGKHRIEDKASKNKPVSIAPGTFTFGRIRIIRFISSEPRCAFNRIYKHALVWLPIDLATYLLHAIAPYLV